MPIVDLVTESVQYVRNVLRGNWEDAPDLFERCTPEHPPVLLLHGFLGTRGALFVLEQRLNNDGFTVFSINLGALNIGDIRRSAYRIHLEIERILEASKGRVAQIDVIGHSMGGLIGLYYAQAMGGHDRVRKLVTLGTPYRGSWFSMAGVATLGLLSPSTWQLLPRSHFLKTLESAPVPLYVELTNIFGTYDLLCPPRTAQREDTVNYRMPLGHAGLTMSQDVYRLIKRTLRRPHEPGRDAGALYELADGRYKRRGPTRSNGAPGAGHRPIDQ